MMVRISIILTCIVFLLSACSNLKHLPANEKLYTGADIEFLDKPQNKSDLKTELTALLRPIPNKKFLGMRIKLSLYNLGKPPKGKGLNYLLRNKWGEPPVLFSKVRAGYTSGVLRNYLWNNSYFDATVDPEVKTTEKTGSVTYRVTVNHSYKINAVYFPSDSSALSGLIRESSEKTLLKAGDPFDLDIIKEERERIDLFLKDKGYFYFTPDNLLFQVDSTIQGKVNLYVKVKDKSPEMNTSPYYIKSIVVYPNYSLESDTLEQQRQVRRQRQRRNYIIVDSTKILKPSVFRRVIVLQTDSLYQRNLHNITLKRLVDLGTFKFIKADFKPVTDSGKHMLNTSFFLTPYPKRSIQLQLTGNSKSNNFVGTELKLQLKNRNMFRGAEIFTASVTAGLEKQVGGTQVSTNSYTLTGDATLLLPRFIFPFKLYKFTTTYVPKTKFNLAYEFLNRPDLYTIHGLSGSAGYVWRQSEQIDHSLTVLGFKYVLPSNTTPKFDSLLENDITLRQSFEKQFLFGSSYNFHYNNQTQKNRNPYTDLNFNIDLSGNLLGLIARRTNDSGQKVLFNVPYSQYVRLTLDINNYWQLNKRFQWVNHLSTGYGYAYGNSEVMPFVRQYFIGGSNSLRAFRARTLGPGSYQSPTSQSIASEAGDIKIEGSSEMRIKLFSVVNAALFVDAGNIWLRKDNPQKPGSDFKNAWKEIAVGTGAGIRFDASIVVIRFDLAFPLRKPYLPDGDRWVFDKIDFSNKQWRKENLILNIAIGYPF